VGQEPARLEGDALVEVLLRADAGGGARGPGEGAGRVAEAVGVPGDAVPGGEMRLGW
jgi:hypothetical protein